MANVGKMASSKKLSKKLSDNALKTVSNFLDITIKSHDLPTAKSAEIRTDNKAIFESQVDKEIDALIAKGLSEDDASDIVFKTYNDLLDELEEEED